VGLDPAPRSTEPLDAALRAKDEALVPKFQILQATTDSVADIGTFDVAISNNTFKHVSDLSKALSGLAPLPWSGGCLGDYGCVLVCSS
jgi:hypothetical protein